MGLVVVMKVAKPPSYSFLILVIGLIILDSLLAWISLMITHILSPSLTSGVVVIAIASAFMVIFTLWFGMYGAIAAYVGGLLGTGLASGLSPSVAVYFSFAYLWMTLLPLITFRVFEVDVNLESTRDLFQLFLFAIVVNNIIAAVWGALSLAMGKIIGWGDLMSVILPWFVGSVIFSLIIVPLVLKRFTPRVEKSKVFVRTYWF